MILKVDVKMIFSGSRRDTLTIVQTPWGCFRLPFFFLVITITGALFQQVDGHPLVTPRLKRDISLDSPSSSFSSLSSSSSSSWKAPDINIEFEIPRFRFDDAGESQSFWDFLLTFGDRESKPSSTRPGESASSVTEVVPKKKRATEAATTIAPSAVTMTVVKCAAVAEAHRNVQTIEQQHLATAPSVDVSFLPPPTPFIKVFGLPRHGAFASEDASEDALLARKLTSLFAAFGEVKRVSVAGREATVDMADVAAGEKAASILNGCRLDGHPDARPTNLAVISMGVNPPLSLGGRGGLGGGGIGRPLLGGGMGLAGRRPSDPR